MFTKSRDRLALAIVLAIPLLFFLGRFGVEALTEQFPTIARPEATLEIRQYPEDRHPWNRGEALQLRLDIDRMRAYGVSMDDVMKALSESSVVDSRRRVEPSLRVVCYTRLNRPDQYERIIVRASADGEIARLKDFARVEVLGDGEGADRPRHNP